MSSPVSPQPVGLPPRTPRRSLAGPVVLIIVGVVSLLATMKILPPGRLFEIYARFWPVLLILWGAIRLYEYMAAQRDGYRPRGIGAGGVFLVIFLIFTGLAATKTHDAWPGIRDNIDLGDEFELWGNHYTYDDQLEQDFPADGSLRVIDDRGAVTVSSSDENKIRVVIRKKIVSDSQADADKYNVSTKPQITVSDKSVTLNANTQGAGDHSVITDMDVFVPRKAAVTINGRRGEIRVLAREGDIDITSQRGDISLEDIKGNAKLSVERASVRVARITGDVTVQGHGNEINVSDIGGSLRLEGEFIDSIRLAKVAKNVSFRSARTDMEFAGLEGDLNLDRGDLEANALAGPLRLVTRSKDIRIEGISGDVRVENSRGSVELRVGKLPLGNVSINNRDADVTVTVPEQAGFKLEARTRNGEISSDFNQVNVGGSEDSPTASGTVGNGNGHVQIFNEHGSIEIRKGNVTATQPAPPTPPSTKTPRSIPAPKEVPEPTEN
jgi:DUF4097 and DUF4098 domain-containing protein YvlB